MADNKPNKTAETLGKALGNFLRQGVAPRGQGERPAVIAPLIRQTQEGGKLEDKVSNTGAENKG